ncbi:hypothetical protein NDU88_008410 [Pleurodeles waltl]|uniref:Uncharacterized protein n=1 Tax=Pleurodeles waltl TaxID=8319 RepID=A0AAV7PT27_PLEWA|nr:hypothetical protein NDU88_008410 [Pleurodeles waltl]
MTLGHGRKSNKYRTGTEVRSLRTPRVERSRPRPPAQLCLLKRVLVSWAPGPGPEEEYPGVLRDGRQLKNRRRGIFQASHAAKQRASTEEFGNEKEGGGRDRGRNSQQGQQRQAEVASPGDAEVLARKEELYRERNETRQCRTEDDRGRGSAGACHVLGRTWPEQVQGWSVTKEPCRQGTKEEKEPKNNSKWPSFLTFYV